VAYRRGFKSEAEQIAGEVRCELGLGSLDRLDPRLLAEHLDIPVVSLTEMAAGNPSRFFQRSLFLTVVVG
jgi:hypothetical protein